MLLLLVDGFKAGGRIIIFIRSSLKLLIVLVTGHVGGFLLNESLHVMNVCCFKFLLVLRERRIREVDLLSLAFVLHDGIGVEEKRVLRK